MTDPIDETQPHATSPGPTSSPLEGAQSASPRAPEAPSPHEAPPSPSAPPSAPRPADAPPPAPPSSSLRVDPDRPKDPGWREPAWFPPRAKDHGPSVAALVAGIALVLVGLYFFLDRTLGVALPRVQWSTVWPVILIAIGAIVLVRSVSRRS